jgi:hypothetical protein
MGRNGSGTRDKRSVVGRFSFFKNTVNRGSLCKPLAAVPLSHCASNPNSSLYANFPDEQLARRAER